MMVPHILWIIFLVPCSTGNMMSNKASYIIRYDKFEEQYSTGPDANRTGNATKYFQGPARSLINRTAIPTSNGSDLPKNVHSSRKSISRDHKMVVNRTSMKLVYVAVVMSTGKRSPIYTYPNFEYSPKMWLLGRGKLTPEGTMQAFRMGSYAGKMYVGTDLFEDVRLGVRKPGQGYDTQNRKKIYHPEQIKILTTDTDLGLVAGNAFGLGFSSGLNQGTKSRVKRQHEETSTQTANASKPDYPETMSGHFYQAMYGPKDDRVQRTEGILMYKNLSINLLPVRMVPSIHDTLLSVNRHSCPRFVDSVERMWADSSEVREVNEMHATLFDYVAKMAGLRYLKWQNLHVVMDALESVIDSKYELPEWLTKSNTTYFQTLEKLHEKAFRLIYCRQPLRQRLFGGPLMHKILNKMIEVADKTLETQKNYFKSKKYSHNAGKMDSSLSPSLFNSSDNNTNIFQNKGEKYPTWIDTKVSIYIGHAHLTIAFICVLGLYGLNGNRPPPGTAIFLELYQNNSVAFNDQGSKFTVPSEEYPRAQTWSSLPEADQYFSMFSGTTQDDDLSIRETNPYYSRNYLPTMGDASKSIYNNFFVRVLFKSPEDKKAKPVKLPCLTSKSGADPYYCSLKDLIWTLKDKLPLDMRSECGL